MIKHKFTPSKFLDIEIIKPTNCYIFFLGHERKQPTPASGARLFSWNSGNLIQTLSFE